MGLLRSDCGPWSLRRKFCTAIILNSYKLFVLTEHNSTEQRVLLEKLIVTQLTNSPPFVGSEGSLQCSQEPSWSRWIQSIPSHYISLRSTLILSAPLQSGLFPSGFPTTILYTLLISAMRIAWPAHLIFVTLITVIMFFEVYKLWNPSLCSLLLFLATSPNILFSTLFSDTLNICSSHNVGHWISHPYKTTGKMIVSYILIF